MFLVCWSPKGGSGTSVVTAALTLLVAARHDRPALAVDLAGDLPSVFGIPESDRPGVTDWLGAGPDVGADRLERLVVDVTDRVGLITTGAGPLTAGADRWRALADHLSGCGRDVVVDCGALPPPELARAADHSLLVVRACYLALRRAAMAACQPTAVVLVKEPGRALNSVDVTRALGVDVIAEVPLEASIARAVDAGLLTSRLPVTLRRSLDDVARAA